MPSSCPSQYPAGPPFSKPTQKPMTLTKSNPCTMPAIKMKIKKQRYPAAVINLTFLLSIHFFIIHHFILQIIHPVTAQEVGGITNGPEDNFFCGSKWDDDTDCKLRQHCPTGRHEECDLFSEGQKCFAYTACDTKFGDGSLYVPVPRPSTPDPDLPPGQSPVPTTKRPTNRPIYTDKSEDPSDHFFCGKGLKEAKDTCANHCPSGTAAECPEWEICFQDAHPCDARNIYIPPPPSPPPTTAQPIDPSAPTKIPTDMPIEPPPPFTYPSDDPTDHWFCGIGIEDANGECRVHCPTGIECPMGQICFFGTVCDARTHMPTPPPTRRPTQSPTLHPTNHPTDSMPPSLTPTVTGSPTAAPTEQIPTRSPTSSPTGRPTFAPMPSIQASFYCGLDWSDAIGNCKGKCPSGEDPECPEGYFCFAYTECKAEKGYPPGTFPEEEENKGGGGGGDGGGGGEDEEEPVVEDCVDFEVMVVADNWPQENSWTLKNEAGDLVLEGLNDELEPGEPVYWNECIPRKECYTFRIDDTGGDGMCCDHGQGSFTVNFNGAEVKYGNAFYDYESVEFGRCEDTPEPTDVPTPSPTKSKPSGGGGGAGGGGAGSGLAGGGVGSGSGYRCVATPLIDSGYVVAVNMCHLFDDCYNQYIGGGDDWFCDDVSQCVEAPACAVSGPAEETPPTPPAPSPPEEPPPASPTPPSVEESPSVEEPSEETTAEEAPSSVVEVEEEVSPTEETPSRPISKPVTTDSTQSKPASPGQRPVAPRPVPDKKPPTVSVPSTPRTRSPVKISNVDSVDNGNTSSSPTDQTAGPTSSTTTTNSTDTEMGKNSTNGEIPTQSPTEGETTLIPTTYSPTHGPCGGIECFEQDHCRSQYGFCGPGDTYCNEKSIWTSDCTLTPTNGPTTLPPVTSAPTNSSAPSIYTTSLSTTSRTSLPTASASAGSTTGVNATIVDSIETSTASPSVIASPTVPTKPSFSKPSGGGKKPVGGGKGKPVSKPSPTNPPTVAQSAQPTKEPTPNPTEYDGTKGPSWSPNTIIDNFFIHPPPTRSPTIRPTKLPTQSPTIGPTSSPSSKLNEDPVASSPGGTSIETPNTDATNTDATDTEATSTDATDDGDAADNTCSGDPCPVETHCRSRYGSCGPGFIYCNSFSTWDSTCPPIIPGVTPTRSPTAKPTKAPSIYTLEPTRAFSQVEIVEEEEEEQNFPTLPPIPKPTLPTITVGIPFTGPSITETDEIAVNKTSEGEQENDGEEDIDSEEVDEKKTENKTVEEEDTFQSDGFLNDWVASNTNRRNSARIPTANGITSFYGFVTSLSFIMLII